MNRGLVLLVVAVLLVGGYLFLVDLPSERRAEESADSEARLLHFSPTEVDTLRLVRARDTVVLARDGEGWRMLSPIQEEVAAHSVDAQLSALANAERVRVVADSLGTADWAEFDLEAIEFGRADIDIVLRDGSTQRLAVGRLSSSGILCYVREENSSRLQTADRQVRTVANLSYHAFRRSDLFEVSADEIVTLDVASSGERFVATRDAAGQWWNEEGHRLKRRDLDSWVYFLATARVEAYLRDDVPGEDWAGYALDRPWGRVRWVARDGRDATLEFGNEAGDGRVYARRKGTSTLLLVADEHGRRAEPPFDAYLDTNPLVVDFDRVDRLRVRSEEDGRWVELTREDAQRDWKIESSTGEVESTPYLVQAARNVALGLEGFQTDAQMMLATEAPLSSVLSKIAMHVDITTPDTTRSLTLGWRGDGAQHWVRIDEEPTLHRVGRDLYLRLRALLEDAVSGR